ncbi:MAG: channel protein hemolysin family [Armatimonadetes bacterium]|nr:channel protein hemolysin family [Armatimonadota bacterium]
MLKLNYGHDEEDVRAKAWRWVREPFNGVSHFAGAILSVIGLILLLVFARGRPWHLAGFLVYGASLVLLYTASTLYHSVHGCPEKINRLMKFDQVAIFALIAGTYTPICLVPLRGVWGWTLLAVVWTIALVGMGLRVGWRKSPHWVPIALYLIMGWMSVSAVGPLCRSLPPEAIQWLFAGGLVYTIGCVVFALKRPRLWPGVFSSHELWHVFVLGGSTCHFVLMLRFVSALP